MTERSTHSLPRTKYQTPREHALPRTTHLIPREDYATIVFLEARKTIKKFKDIVSGTPREPIVAKKKLALLLPGHNEELIIQSTIGSAIASGMDIDDIYVVNDGSTDKTRGKAISLLGRKQVFTVERSGKARAILQAIKHFEIQDRYEWLHIADADSVFGENYFNIYRDALKGKKYVVAAGSVQSLRGNWLADYRAFNYMYSQHIVRRWQSWFGMIAAFPEPITSFRTDILDQLDFTVGSVTDDFDLSLQAHRKRLGKIRYIPGAINYTQDPKTIRDFFKQTARWQRGFFQGLTRYRIRHQTSSY